MRGRGQAGDRARARITAPLEGAGAAGGVIGSGDLTATEATLLAAALGCGAVLAQRVTGWPRLRRSPAR